MVLAEQSQEGPKSALLKDVVTALGAVTSNVAESPYSLLPNVVHARRKQFDEFWHSTSANNSLSVFGSTRRDIRERP